MQHGDALPLSVLEQPHRTKSGLAVIDDLLADLGALYRVSEQGCYFSGRSGLDVLGQPAGERGSQVGVHVIIHRHVLSTVTRLFHQAQIPIRITRGTELGCVVGDLHGDTRFTPDADGFVHPLQDGLPLAADV